jgi:hypothetical protein
MAVKISFDLFFLAALLPALLLAQSDAIANIHGVDTVRVVAADQSPAYDLEQIEDEVTGAVSRTKRNLWVRVAILEIDPLNPAGRNDCGSKSPVFAGVGLLCEMGNAVEQAVRDAAVNEAITQSIQSHVKSDPELAPDLAANVDKLLSSNLLQLRLASSVSDFVEDQTGIGVIGANSDAVPGHRLTTNLVKVEAVGNKLDSRIAIRLHGEIVLARNRDGRMVDQYKYIVETPGHFIEGWSKGGIGMLAKSFSDGVTKMAEVLAEEVLLVVTSPHQRRQGYLVQPIKPKYKISLFGGSDDFISVGGEYHRTDTLQPAFAWEDFRAAYTEDPLYAGVPASKLKVSYDLRIYRSLPGRDAKPMLYPGSVKTPTTLYPGEMLYEFRGIIGEEFAPGIKFEHCMPYAWTVRARFVVDGKTHLTYWSGAYKEKKVEKLREWRTSQKRSARAARSAGVLVGWDYDEMMREKAQYFPFLATSTGQKCSKEEILAAMARKSP